MNLLSALRSFRDHRRVTRDLKDALSTLRLAIRMREDVAPADLIADARKAESDLLALLRARRREDLPPHLADRLAKTSGFDLYLGTIHAAGTAAARLYPTPSHPKLRENVEVLVVAISLALACRTYLVQPFKIPTGSMQPTLNGVLAAPALEPALSDRFPANLFKLAIYGKRFVQVRAKTAGRVEWASSDTGEAAFRINGIIHPIRVSFVTTPIPRFDPDHSFHLHVQPGQFVQKGDLLATGYVTGGDHVFVNKLRYRFSRPRRGDIIVFDTNLIPPSPPYSVARDTFYIKRLAGLPGESISIADRQLLADGAPVTSPYPFQRLLSEPGYDGYALQPNSRLATASDSIDLAPDEFLPFGDNTHSSLDGRYFGGVPLPALVGPAFFVYWPFGPHFGTCQ